jgi:hypothetical protein
LDEPESGSESAWSALILPSECRSVYLHRELRLDPDRQRANVVPKHCLQVSVNVAEASKKGLKSIRSPFLGVTTARVEPLPSYFFFRTPPILFLNKPVLHSQ